MPSTRQPVKRTSGYGCGGKDSFKTGLAKWAPPAVIVFSMHGSALAREKHPVPTFAESEMVRGVGEVSVGVEALDCGFYLLNVVRGWGFGIVDQREGRGNGLSIYGAGISDDG
jgi:hypothetical protein